MLKETSGGGRETAALVFLLKSCFVKIDNANHVNASPRKPVTRGMFVKVAVGPTWNLNGNERGKPKELVII